MLNKNLFIFIIIFIKTSSAFTAHENAPLQDLLMNRVFSKEHWSTYKPILIKNINKIPKDLFQNRTFKGISFSGIPLKDICFEKCKFIDTDFKNMDLSQTTFKNCKFKNVQIDGVQLKGGFIFKDTITHHNLILNYSQFMNDADIFKSQGSDEKARICYEAAESLNNFVFKAIKISLKDITLQNCNLKGIHLEKTTLKNVKFINCNLQEAQFNHSKFIQCSLENADLTTASFEKTKFNEVNLNQATLCEGFKLGDNLSIENLVGHYSHLNSNGEKEKAQALNKILGTLDVSIYNLDFSNLNLNGINLSNNKFNNINFTNANLAHANFTNTDFSTAIIINANLTETNLTNADLSSANIQGIKLSETLFINYQSTGDLLEQWNNASEENKPLYQKLVNARVKFFEGWSNEDFITFFNRRDKTQVLNLRNTDLYKAQLQNMDFKNIDIKNANLIAADLTNADFRETDITQANIKHAILNNTKLSNTLTFDPNNTRPLFDIWIGLPCKDQKICQFLINSGFNIFEDVPYQELKDFFDQRDRTKKLNLKNANLNRLDLHEINFEGANLQEACLQRINLANANLIKANLKNAYIYDTYFYNADLTHANLKGASLEKNNLTGTKFIRSNLTNAINYQNILNNTDFSQAILKRAGLIDWTRIEIKNINLDGADLREALIRCDAGVITKFPNYKNINELFNLWINGEQVFKDFCEILVHAQFNFFQGVPHEKLVAFFNHRDHSTPLDLTNANLSGTDLHDINLKGVDLTNANLSKTNLIGVQWKGSHLINANIKGAILSSTFTVPEDCSDQYLFIYYNLFDEILDIETKKALKAVLIAKELIVEDWEPDAKRLKTH